MTSPEILEWVKTIGGLICSYPMATIFAIFIFRKPILDLMKRFASPDITKAEFGPVKFERELGELAEKGKQAVDNMSQLNLLMAESRLLELEITEGNFGAVFSKEQREKMREHIESLRKLTEIKLQSKNK